MADQAAQLKAATDAAAAAETARAVAVSELDQLKTFEHEAALRAEEDRTRLVGTFAELSAEALAKNNEHFLTLADTRLGEARTAAQGDLARRHEAIEELLHPLSETLARYERGLQAMEVERKGAYASLNERVAALARGARAAAKGDAEPGDRTAVAADTRSLGGNDAAQHGRGGRHGRALRLRGAAVDADRGRHVRPDMVVHLPGGGQVVIDAKVPARGVPPAHRGRGRGGPQEFLDKHARQLRTHVDQLAKKEYWKHVERSPEFVIAFIPGESLLAAACEADPGLQDHALSKRIVLATPNTLVAALRTIALSWQQERLADNARQVQQLGAELYERLRSMTGHMQSLQRSLTSSVDAYNKAIGSLESRVLVTARKFPALGVVGNESPQIAELSPIEAAPRHLQAVELLRRGRRDDESADHRGAARRRRQHRPPGLTPTTAAPEHRRRTLPECCTPTAPIAPTRLVAKLAELVAVPLDDPMVPEVVSVPTQGIERWLTQRLSAHLGARPGAHDGVCANVGFPFPGSADLGRPGAGLGHRSQGGSLVARTCGLAAHGGGGRALRRAVAVAAGPAHPQLGDGGGVEALLEHPPRGRPLRPLRRPPSRHAPALGRRGDGDEPRPPGRSGSGSCCATASGRRARPSGWSSRASACGTNPTLLDLPPRLSLFGLTRLAASYLDVLEAVAVGTRGASLLVAPLARRSGTASPRRSARRRASSPGRPTRRRARRATRCSPLGAATPGRCSWCWARPCPTATTRRDAGRPGGLDTAAADPRRRPFRPRARRRRERQDDDARPLLDADDDSIRVHSCHGRGRQVEVLRDAILHLLDADPSLEPRDIIVMCPDIENFAPLIQATFGSHDLNDGDPLTPRAPSRSAWPTARCARPIRSWASWPRSSSSRPPGSRRARCSTWRDESRSAGGSASATTTCSVWRSGSAARSCAGASTRRTGPPSGWPTSDRTPGRRDSTGSFWAWPWPKRTIGSSAAPFPSTTSTAATSTWPGAWPSSWTASATALDDLAGTRTIDAWAETLARIADSLDRDDDRVTPGSGRSWPRSSRSWSPRPARAQRSARSSSAATTCVRSWPTACGDARRVRTSARVTSPCARSCPCGRSPTVWCACSGWTTAASRATSSATATT